MDTEQVPTVTTLPEATPVVEKKKFYRNPKIIASAAAGLIAVAVVAVLKGSQQDDSDSTPEVTEEAEETVEIFEP